MIGKSVRSEFPTAWKRRRNLVECRHHCIAWNSMMLNDNVSFLVLLEGWNTVSTFWAGEPTMGSQGFAPTKKIQRCAHQLRESHDDLFFDCKGSRYILERSATTNAQQHMGTLQKLKCAIKSKIPGMLTDRNLITGFLNCFSLAFYFVFIVFTIKTCLYTCIFCYHFKYIIV